MKKSWIKRGKGFTKKRKPINRVSKSPKRQAEIEADDLWRDCIRKRDDMTCQYCGKKAVEGGSNVVIQAHHITTRANKKVRHSLDNGILLCRGCHKFQAHGNPENFRDFLINRMGQESFDALKLRSNIARGKYDPKMNVIALRELLRELEGGRV